MSLNSAGGYIISYLSKKKIKIYYCSHIVKFLNSKQMISFRLLCTFIQINIDRSPITPNMLQYSSPQWFLFKVTFCPSSVFRPSLVPAGERGPSGVNIWSRQLELNLLNVQHILILFTLFYSITLKQIHKWKYTNSISLHFLFLSFSTFSSITLLASCTLKYKTSCSFKIFYQLDHT